MKSFRIVVAAFLLSLICPELLFSEEEKKEQVNVMEEILVETERVVEKQDKITIRPEGLPAQVDIITKDEIQRTPYTGDVLDILRKVPGLNVQKYPRGDMGHQIGLRGFIGNNGVAVFVDGVPVNTLHWWNGQVEIGWLIPEMIERVEVIKGPFSALYGNFALGGTINFVTRKSDPSSSLGGYGGSFATGRGVGVFSDPSLQYTPFLVWEGYIRDGYRENSDYQRGQFFNKVTFPLWQGDVSVRAHYAARTWSDAGYLKIEEMKKGIVSRTSAVNLTDRGDSEMADVVVNYSPHGGEEGLHATLYYSYLWNATGRTFPPSPQARRDSSENYCGWRLLYDYRPFDQLSLIAGNELRYDSAKTNDMSSLNYYTITKVKSLYDFNQFNTAFFVQGQYKPFSFFKLVGGLRYDTFNIDVNNILYPQNSGNAYPDIWSPKIGLVITPYQDINIYANKGTGFLSPSPSQLSPASATQKANFDLGLAKLDTWDVGINALLFKRLQINIDYYNTLYQREQWLNPATLVYENLGASKRTGVEVEAKIFLTNELTFYGSWADVRARLKNPQTPGAVYITGQPEDISTVGINYQKAWAGGGQQAVFDFCYARSGRKPVDTSGALIGSQFDRYLMKVSYRYKKWTASVDACFTPRKYAADTYTTQSGEIAIIPYPTWDVLAGIRYQF
ncbi:TonB-dependent receptor [Desulfobacca acetoxidans]